MGFYQLALFPRFWLKALEKWNLTVDLHTALKGPPARLFPRVAGLCCILSHGSVSHFYLFIYFPPMCFLPSSNFTPQVEPITGERSGCPPAYLRPDTGILPERSYQKQHKWDTGVRLHSVFSFYSFFFFDAHICLMNDNTQRELVAFFYLMGPSRHTIQAVQRKWAH